MKKVKLEEVISLKKGKKADIHTLQTSQSKRYIQIDDLRNDDNLKFTDSLNITEVLPEDILIAWDGANAGTIGYGLSGAIGSTITVLKQNEYYKDKILSDYLALFLESKSQYLRDRATGATIPHLNKNILLNLQLELLHPESQDNIVNTLNIIKRVIAKRNFQLNELNLLVKSRFNEMFGDPVLNEMGWEKHRLSKLTLKIGSGATPRGGRESYVNEGIALIRSMNVYDGKFIFKDLAYLTNVQAEKLNNVIVESDDVLLNITGASVSRCCIVPQIILPARVNQHVSIIRCKKHLLSPIFLNQLLITSEFKSLLQKIGESSGATRQAITKNQIEELTIPIPPLSLQNEFADFVAQIDKSQFACQMVIKLWRNSLKSSII